MNAFPIISRSLYGLWRRPWLMSLHLSLLLIVIGGAITFLGHKEGDLRLTPHLPANEYVTTDGSYCRLPFTVTLNSFDIEYYSDGDKEKDYNSEISINSYNRESDERSMWISMNHPARIGAWWIYQKSYDKNGSVLLGINYDPIGRYVTFAGYLLFALSGFFLLYQRFGRSIMGIVMLVAIAAILSYLYYRGHYNTDMMPVLRSGWLTAHVSLVSIGYLLLAATMPISVYGLVSPTTKCISRCNGLLLTGVYFLGLGIFVGAVWASVSWGNYWNWDPKETWALITLIIYSIPLHLSLFRFGGSKDGQASSVKRIRRLRRLYFSICILGFLSMIMTYAGITYLTQHTAITSLHAY